MKKFLKVFLVFGALCGGLSKVAVGQQYTSVRLSEKFSTNPVILDRLKSPNLDPSIYNNAAFREIIRKEIDFASLVHYLPEISFGSLGTDVRSIVIRKPWKDQQANYFLNLNILFENAGANAGMNIDLSFLSNISPTCREIVSALLLFGDFECFQYIDNKPYSIGSYASLSIPCFPGFGGLSRNCKSKKSAIYFDTNGFRKNSEKFSDIFISVRKVVDGSGKELTDHRARQATVKSNLYFELGCPGKTVRTIDTFGSRNLILYEEISGACKGKEVRFKANRAFSYSNGGIVFTFDNLN